MAEMKPMEVEVKPVNVKWEYRAEALESGLRKDIQILNDLGLQGWELVNVTPDTEDSYSVAYLKRIKDNG